MNANRTVRRLPCLAPAAFTLIEAAVALAITAVAGSALLLGIESTLQNADEALEQTVANGMAQQLMDEILGNRYMEQGVDPYQTVLCPSAQEASTGTRELFDDIDDFHGWTSEPAVDADGIMLGTEDGSGGRRNAAFDAPGDFFAKWRQEVSVCYVSGSSPATPLAPGVTSDYRAVEVRIYRRDAQRGLRLLSTIRRVIAYVPPLE